MPRRLVYPWVPLVLYITNVVMFGIVDAAYGFMGPALLAGGLGALVLWSFARGRGV